VSVPVTSGILDPQVDGTSRINADKMAALAIEMAASPDVRWHVENAVIELHPIQRPKDVGE